MCACVTLVLTPTAADAGTIYGVLSDGRKAVANAAIEIKCGNEPSTKGVSLRDGSYRVNVPQQGPCTFRLPGYPGAPSARVTSYRDPSQYDFELVKTKSGYQLRRR